jgi:hypothetical protein
MPVRIKVKSKPGTPAGDFFESEAKRKYDIMADALLDELSKAAERMRGRLSGAQTGYPGVPGAQLRRRSGDAAASIDFGVIEEHEERFYLRAHVGAILASAEVDQYLETQNIGRTITPRYAPKLAFPPGDAGPPIRDGNGVQLYYRYEAIQRKEELGFAWIWDTEGATYGRPIGTRDAVLLFIRRDFVNIPARAPIDVEKSVLDEQIALRFQQIVDS